MHPRNACKVLPSCVCLIRQARNIPIGYRLKTVTLLVQEFHPYVFQIFAQLIELRPAPLPTTYMAIFRPLLAPVFWERPGNIPALTRLLQAYCAKAMPEITQQGLLEVRHLPPPK